MRKKVADAWSPLAHIYQAWIPFAAQVNIGVAAGMNPLFVVFAVASTLLSVLPYVVVELLINCNPSDQVKRQSKLARESIDVVLRMPIPSMPGVSEIKRALTTVRPFLVAGEAGRLPSVSEVAPLAKAGGILDGIPAEPLGALLDFVAFTSGKGGGEASAAPFTTSMTKLQTTPDTTAKDAAKKVAIAEAKAKAKKEAIKKATIAAAKRRAKDEAERKAAERAAANGTASTPTTSTAGGIPLAAKVAVVVGILKAVL